MRGGSVLRTAQQGFCPMPVFLVSDCFEARTARYAQYKGVPSDIRLDSETYFAHVISVSKLPDDERETWLISIELEKTPTEVKRPRSRVVYG
jgi:hypothetical protein